MSRGFKSCNLTCCGIEPIILWFVKLFVIIFAVVVSLVKNPTWSLPDLHIYISEGDAKMGVIWFSSFVITLMCLWLLERQPTSGRGWSHSVIFLIPIIGIVSFQSILVVAVILAAITWSIARGDCCPNDRSAFVRLNDEVTVAPIERQRSTLPLVVQNAYAEDEEEKLS